MGTNSYRLDSYYPTSGLRTYYDRSKRVNAVKFCLRHLSIEDYKHFGNRISMLMNDHSYDYVKKLIIAVGPSGVSYDEYCYTLRLMYDLTPVPEESLQAAINFLNWLWQLEGFDEQRKSFLNKVSFSNLGWLLSPKSLRTFFYTVLESLTDQKVKYIVRNGGGSLCCDLYMKNEREILKEKILCHCKNGDGFIDKIDKIILNKIKENTEGADANHGFELFVQGKRDEFSKYVQPFVSEEFDDFFYYLESDCVLDNFYRMLGGKFNFTESIVSTTCVGDFDITQHSSMINKR